MRSLALAALCAAGCIHAIEEDESTVGVVVRDCRVPGELGAPVSLEYPDRSLWIWPDAAAYVTSADEVCAAGPSLGPPILTLTAEEEAENQARTDGRRLVLRPTGGFAHQDVGYLFYERLIAGPGFFDEELLGTGLCTVAPGATACERQAAFWTPDERVLDQGGVVDGDRALVYGCRPVASFLSPCVVTGVPLDRLSDAAAYQVWNAFSGWVDELGSASSFADELGALTLSPWDERWLAASVDPFTGQVYARFSSSASGGFGHRIALFTVPRTASGFVAGGREHAGLRREPRTLHLSYAADGLHLVTFRFHGDVE